MFAPETYWRQFELHNEAWASAVPWILASGWAWLLAWAWWTIGRGPGPGHSPEEPRAPRDAAVDGRAIRAGLLALAVASAAVAGGYLPQRLAPIFWAAQAYAWGFGMVALGLLAMAAWPGRNVWRCSASPLRRRTGWMLGACALAVYPALAWLSGRPAAGAEILGLAPDPVAVATLGWLAAMDTGLRPARWLRRAVMVSFGLWGLLSATTLATMGSWQALVPALVVVASGVAGRFGR